MISCAEKPEPNPAKLPQPKLPPVPLQSIRSTCRKPESLSSLWDLTCLLLCPWRLLADQVVEWPIQGSEGTLTLAQRSATEEAVRATKSPLAVLEPYSPFIDESLPLSISPLSASSQSTGCQEPMWEWQSSQRSDPPGPSTQLPGPE